MLKIKALMFILENIMVCFEKPKFRHEVIMLSDRILWLIDSLNIRNGRNQLIKHLRLFPDLLKSKQQLENLQFEPPNGRDRDEVDAEIISLDVNALYNTILYCDITKEDYIWFNRYVDRIISTKTPS